MKKHWYKIFISECPVCWRGGTHRERQYGKKPKRSSLRYLFKQVYDFCIESGRS